MKITTDKQKECAVVRLEGNIDGQTAPVVQSEILPMIASHPNIMLDVSKVGYMSSAGLRVLLLLYRQVAAKNGKAVIVGLSDAIKETMEMTGFLDFFTLAATEEEGMKKIKN